MDTNGQEVSKSAVCRVCLSEEEPDPHIQGTNEKGQSSNPLFSPCKCAGTMGLIHIDCL